MLKPAYDKILKNIEADLTANIHGHFQSSDLEKIYSLAKEKFVNLAGVENSKNEDELKNIWHKIVADFHTHGYWGFKKKQTLIAVPNEKKQELSLTTFIPTFLIPLIFTKSAILYFGINWGNYPGEGYGYGFFASVMFGVINFSYFLWRNRKYKED